jgi:hypothetical protein
VGRHTRRQVHAASHTAHAPQLALSARRLSANELLQEGLDLVQFRLDLRDPLELEALFAFERHETAIRLHQFGAQLGLSSCPRTVFGAGNVPFHSGLTTGGQQHNDR